MHEGRKNGVGFAIGASWVDDPMQEKQRKVNRSNHAVVDAGLWDSKAASNLRPHSLFSHVDSSVAVRYVTLWFRVDVPGVLVSSSSSSSSS